MDAEPVLPGNVVAACEVEVDPVIEVDPGDDEAGPPAPSPTVPKPLIPSPAVPRLDVSVEEALAVPAALADEPVVALQGADVLPCVPIRPAVLPPCAAVELAAAVAPRLRPPPSNVGSIAVLGLADEHAVEFVGPDWPVALCDMPAPARPSCNGDVGCGLGIGGMLVCATLMPMPGPASAMTMARKRPIRVCGRARVPERVPAA